MTESRDYWKKIALTGQRELSIAQTLDIEDSKPQENTTTKTNAIEVVEQEILLETSVPKGHVYPVFVIQLDRKPVRQGLASLRGCQLNFELFSPFFELTKTPSFSCIRNWLSRIGLDALTQPKIHRDDWILIPDLIAEFGKMRA